MIHFDACDTCEFRGTSLPCHARTSGHRPFCGDPRFRDFVRERTLAEADIDNCERLRVGLLCPCLVVGGGESWQATLVRSLPEYEWVGACVVDPAGPVSPPMARATEALLPVSYGREAAAALARKCEVLITWGVNGLRDLLPAGPNRPTTVAVSHMPAESDWGRTACGDLGEADIVVAVSELALAPIPEARRAAATVIGNAVDPARLEARRGRAGMRATWGVPEDAPLVGYLGRISPEKDPHAAVRLAEALPPPWHVVVVGDGRERAALDLLARAGPAADRVRVVGVDPAAGDVLGALDVLLVPSRYESFGLTIVEGLWAGVPVVSTEVGVAKIVPGLTRPIPVGASGPAIADAVLADAADPEGVRARVERGRDYARTHCAPSAVAAAWRSLLAGARPTPPPPPRPSPPPSPTPAQSLAPLLAPALRDAVLACPDRGGVLPISMQEDCGCQGRELTECRAGRGKVPGRVTLADCLKCRRDNPPGH